MTITFKDVIILEYHEESRTSENSTEWFTTQ